MTPAQKVSAALAEHGIREFDLINSRAKNPVVETA